MKRVLLFIFLLVFFVGVASVALATSGACSWHGGVNCAAGPDWDGSVICNDGWRESSVSYYDIKECSPRCTSDELESLWQKYGVEERQAKLNEIIKETESLSEQMDETDDPIESSYLADQIQTLLFTYKLEKDLLDDILNEVDMECSVLGYDRQQQKYLDDLKKQQELWEKEQEALERSWAEQEALLEQMETASCPVNSTYSNGQCFCNSGFVADGNVCITVDNYCKNKYGSNAHAKGNSCVCDKGFILRNNKCITHTEDCIQNYGVNTYGTKVEDGGSACHCVGGYEWNSSQTACIKSITCPKNSNKIGNTCVCKDGYLMQDNKCKTYTEYCIQKFGPNVYGTGYDDNVSCHCKDGYEWNLTGTACVEKIKLLQENKKDVEIGKQIVVDAQQQEGEIIEQDLEEQEQKQEQEQEEEQEQKSKRIISTFLASISAAIKNFFHRLSCWF